MALLGWMGCCLTPVMWRHDPPQAFAPARRLRPPLFCPSIRSPGAFLEVGSCLLGDHRRGVRIADRSAGAAPSTRTRACSSRLACLDRSGGAGARRGLQRQLLGRDGCRADSLFAELDNRSVWNDAVMAFTLDTSQPLRTHDELVELVRAVVAANPEDESRALEWKSSFADITAQPASFALARTILGMANRSVSVAMSQFKGVGYIVVGAEPGVIRGQTIPDSAVLLNAVRRYTGHRKPTWDPRSVSVDGAQVLVITVDAPQPGDRIAMLQRSFQPQKGGLVPEGAVFVRNAGSTDPATRSDIEMLQDRLLDGVDVEAKATREATRHKEIRDLVADMTHAAKSWVESMEVMILAGANNGWSRENLTEWVNTDSGRAMTVNAQMVSQNARRLRLITNDPALLDPLEAAQALMNNPNPFDAVWRAGPSTSEARSAAYRHIYSIRAAFQAVERSTSALLSGPV